MFHNFELRMFAVGNDVLSIQLAIGDDLGQRIHNLRIWTDRIRGDDVDIRQTHGLGDRLAAGQELFAFVYVFNLGFFSNHRNLLTFLARALFSAEWYEFAFHKF